MSLSLTDAAVLAYFVVLVTAAWWTSSADREWRRRIAARGLVPELAPGGLADRAQDSLADEVRYLVRGFSIGRRLKDLAAHADPDPDTESWRVRGLHRLHLLGVTAVVAWWLPIATLVLPVWYGRLRPATDLLVALFLLGAIAILASLALRFVRTSIAYGNGQDVPFRRVVGQSFGLFFALGVFWVLAALGPASPA
jgi:hypothetical protein